MISRTPPRNYNPRKSLDLKSKVQPELPEKNKRNPCDKMVCLWIIPSVVLVTLAMGMPNMQPDELADQISNFPSHEALRFLLKSQLLKRREQQQEMEDLSELGSLPITEEDERLKRFW